MTKARATGRVFSIPTGAPFLRTFARALLDGQLIDEFPGSRGPMALASATIFVSTNRAAIALADELRMASPRQATLLPRIIPLGHFESGEDESALIAENGDQPRRRKDEVSELERRLVLARLIREWAGKVGNAIVGVTDDGIIETVGGEPLLIGSSFGAAWTLATRLGELIDEFATEGVSWTRLDSVAPDEFDPYWRITLEFLRIAMTAWPAYLDEKGLIDRVVRQSELVDAEISSMFANPAAGPYIVAGSTGANATTARLLTAIARHPNGAIVLPGLDSHLNEATWTGLSGVADGDGEPVATHPQTAMARLLRRIALERRHVEHVGFRDPALAARAELVAEAMRPAESTDAWRLFRHAPAFNDILSGIERVDILEAADEREEALCIALKLRECLELKRRAALVTPDRNIARRVRSQLTRWNVRVDDSAGAPLAETSHGSHASLILDAASVNARRIDLAALLSHSLTRFGIDEAEYDGLARLVDLAVLRGQRISVSNPDDLLVEARRAAEARGAHPNLAAISEEDWDRIATLLRLLNEALEPLRAATGQFTIAEWASRHCECIERTRSVEAHADGDGHAELASNFSELLDRGQIGGSLSFDDYRLLFDQLLKETPVRQRVVSHQAIYILGLLEARVLDFEYVVVAGLEEGLWPPQPRTEPFLNRAMRAQLGLPSPDRRIGQTAHDLVQLLGAPGVLITRSAKRDGSPTVPSRFTQRLAALASSQQWNSAIARGTALIALVRRLDATSAEFIPPPKPRPILELRPLSLSVTRIETLRRDPYSIYAENILRLRPVEELDTVLGPREFGTALHNVIAKYSQSAKDRYSPDSASRALIALAQDEFAEFFSLPGFPEFSWPRIVRVLDAYEEWEQSRAAELRVVELEQAGRLNISLDDGTIFELTARADRIEQHSDGSAMILDYKTGRLPSPREINAGFAPQLILEARMLAGGAFGAPWSKDIHAAYVKLGGPDDLEFKRIGSDKQPFSDLVLSQMTGLKELLNQLRRIDTAFVSRPYPQFLNRYGDYDHLARVKEWSAGIDATEAPE